VYNALDALRTAGLVMAADAGPGRTLYEADTGWHHHFVCRECGAVVDVPCVEGEKPCIDAGVPGLEVDEAQIIFRGRCEACA
jgi:Fur family ferric uptake transcriptional regulator